MKKGNLLGLVFFCLSLTSCEEWFHPRSRYEHSLLVYMAADNSLSELAKTNMQELLAHASLPEDHALFVYTDGREQGAYLIRIYKRNHITRADTLFRYGMVNSAHPDMLEQAIKHAREVCPAKTYGLILWSHGTGWLPAGLYGETPKYAVTPLSLTPVAAFQYNIDDPAYPRTKTFAKDGSAEMEIPDLAGVLKRFTHEYVCFDACLMADIQTYYRLKDVSRYLMGSPTEIIDTGFPYDKLTISLFPYVGESSLIALCNAYYNKYNEQTGYYRSATISLVRTDRIQEVALAFKNLINNSPTDPLTVDRTGLQTYDRLTEHVFWDMDRMAALLGSAEDYATFSTALKRAVVFKKATDNFITIPIEYFSGLAAYLPVTTLPRTQEAFEATAWNKYLGWMPRTD